MNHSKYFILFIVIVMLSSCGRYRGRTAIQPDEAHTKDHISEYARSEDRDGNTSSKLVAKNGQFLTHLERSSASPEDAELAKKYLDSGLTAVDLYCQEFFKQISTSQAHRQFLRSQTNQVGGFVSAILGITNAGSNVTGGVGALFSFLDASVENYDAAFLVAPDLPTVQDLINRTQRTLALELLGADVKYNYPQAERALVMYANNCTFNGIRTIVNKSLSTTNPNVDISKNKPVAAPLGAPDGTKVDSPNQIRGVIFNN